MLSGNLPFYVGGYFLDRNQGYTVKELSSNRMQVEYDDERVEVYNREDMEIKARIYENMLTEFEDYHPEAFTAGLPARCFRSLDLVDPRAISKNPSYCLNHSWLYFLLDNHDKWVLGFNRKGENKAKG